MNGYREIRVENVLIGDNGHGVHLKQLAEGEVSLK